MSKITSTGGLRQFLLSSINSVANGTMDTEKARNITKLAAQVNESIYSEIKAAQIKLQINEVVDAFGQLTIGRTDGSIE